MKRVLAILFLVIYTSAVFGTVVSIRYCSKQVSKVAMPGCKECNGYKCNHANKLTDCCKSHLLYHKVDNHSIVPSIYVSLPHFNTGSSIYDPDIILRRKIPGNTITNNFDLRSCTWPLYLRIRVFRI
ncbi:hypothetical protein FW778_12530 [Ginsengibacter hankyongi]|uniref:Uncharacterized protein n=1 Tax=Ginsengibacter hankyongi TaxID=2607284 RepID=A0A5J5IEY5_9BACT|nr:hypothetical protein [Ginsengibacter hankyongi]KAA9038392.1 hypothetical protein FW778_12530 [Ginsengibacter hankyongi]